MRELPTAPSRVETGCQRNALIGRCERIVGNVGAARYLRVGLHRLPRGIPVETDLQAQSQVTVELHDCLDGENLTPTTRYYFLVHA